MKKTLFFALLSFLTFSSANGQRMSVEDALWDEVGGRPGDMLEDEASRQITDDAANGYLQIASTQEGCGCYYETTAAAYRQVNDDYTILKADWDACAWKKTLSTNTDLFEMLPEDFGLHTFLPKSKETEYQITSAVFYLEAEIPRKGTDTKIDLSYIPFGIHMTPEDHVLSYGYEQLSEHGGSNFLYSGALQTMLRKITDQNTLECILEHSIESIVSEDKELVQKLYGKGKTYAGIEELAAQIRQLKTIYEIAKDVEYKSIILGWDRDEARFYIKEKIKNDAPDMSFLEFVQQLPFLVAIC